MGVAPSRETIRRGFFNVNQANSGGSGNNKRQDIVLIPLTKEYFPSPDCPLFVQFHKARCDAAVNYYFRRPGNPGDLSCIPNYASSYRLPGEETRAQRRRRRRLAREARAAAAAAAAQTEEGRGREYDDNDDDIGYDAAEDGSDDGDLSDEDDSFPSREALYRGVIEHVEEALFDTDAEMRQAYQWALAHPHTTMGPDGRKQRKVLPVLCAVAFRSDVSRVHSLHSSNAAGGVGGGAAATAAAATGSRACGGAATPSGSSLPPPSSSSSSAMPPPPASSTTTTAAGAAAAASHMSSSSIAMNNMQAALENGVYMFGSIINIVGCFGFVSMQEDAADAQRASQQAGSSSAVMSPPLLTPGSMLSPSANGGMAATATATAGGTGSAGATGGTYHHDPYSFTSSQASSGSMAGIQTAGRTASGGTLLSTRGAGKKGVRHLAHIGSSADLITLPPPVAAPLAAMVFLTKSAGEQNLGRVTHIAASTYYYQMIQAGVIERQSAVRMEGPNVYTSPTTTAAPSSLPPYASAAGAAAAQSHHAASSLNSGSLPGAPPPPPPMYSPVTAAGPGGLPLHSPAPSSPTTTAAQPGPPRPFLPPMETFSFSSLLTNIPVLSFLYEMKWRWGYLGVLKAGTPTAGTSRNSSFTGSMSGQPASATSARGPGTMMGNHSTGGLAAADGSVGQGVTDELEMWITMDQMIHGRISKDLAQRLCWSLAERPEVMQERVSQLPSEESGYWRYRGLADKSHPPPVPEPGKVVAIHPKDAYVMGSDVLPGFNEGDILRFDAERLVWFADHSIPLEGLVLAAMRPYCKQAREADPQDPSWVTKVCDREEAEALHEGEMDGFYPSPRPTAEEAAMLAQDENLVHIHEHVGNFYVYRFVRDGTTYYHGTVPNFANPNKKKQQQPHAASAHASAQAAASAMGGGGAEASTAPSAAQHADAWSGAPGSAAPTTKTATTTATAATTAAKASVPVPRTIASALFSLLPTSSATGSASAATGSGATNSASGNSGAAGSLGESAAAAGGGAGSGGTGAGAAAPPPPPPSTAYLATPVTSHAMKTARRWVQALYSYAYGAPTSAASATAAAPGGAGWRGPTAAHLSSAGTGGGSGGSQSAAPPHPPSASPSYHSAGGPSMRGGQMAVPPLRTVPSEAAGGSYPTTPVHTPHGQFKTPTSALGSSAFPTVAAYDVAVWPTRRFMAPGAATPNSQQLGGPHSRTSSLSQLRPAGGAGQPGEEAPAVASKPIKRYLEGGSYEWDWRTQ